MVKQLALALPLAAMAITAPAAAKGNPGNARVVAVEAMLLYEETGAMSENIAGNDDFTPFNTIIGEGSAAENASDLVIRAVIDANSETFLEVPLVITVYDIDGNVLDSRTIETLLLNQRTYRAMMFEDGTCAGEITIEAKLGTSVKRETLNLLCGE
jgi:hypothetical protein